MRKNTVKPALTPKRAKRVVETTKFDAFAKRILRAYARRVAAGDVEALRTLVGLSSELDDAARQAVAGLRAEPYCYSWSEIADRLGCTRQAAQMRYGDRTDRHALDHRLLAAGLGVSVATLVEVFAAHHPGRPASSVCPGCGYRYPDGVAECPTNATVRPLLLKRRGEDRDAVARLSPDQFADLHRKQAARITNTARHNTSEPATAVASLFDLATGAGTGGTP